MNELIQISEEAEKTHLHISFLAGALASCLPFMMLGMYLEHSRGDQTVTIMEKKDESSRPVPYIPKYTPVPTQEPLSI